MRTKMILAFLAALLVSLQAQPAGPVPPTPLADAEVRLPYSELVRLLDAARAGAEAGARPPVGAALLGTRLRVEVAGDSLVLKANFRAATFDDHWALIPLLGVAPTVAQASPPESRLVVEKEKLCLLGAAREQTAVDLVFNAAKREDRLSCLVQPCATSVLEIAAPPADLAVIASVEGKETAFIGAGSMSLPTSGGSLVVTTRPRAEVAALIGPPQPSLWNWQHQIAVILDDGELHCSSWARGSTTGGAGLEAAFFLPGEARSVRVGGDDMEAARVTREADGRIAVKVGWKTREVLDRQLRLDWRLPVGPLDTAWKLSVPTGRPEEKSRARLYLVESPVHLYQAPGLSEPVVPAALPHALEEQIEGRPCRIVETDGLLEIGLKQKTVAATDDAVIEEASWTTRLEADGALLTEGKITINHHGAGRFKLALPEGHRLLRCAIGSRSAAPVELAPGTLEIAWPGGGETTRSEIEIACTARQEAFHPVEGSCALALPRTPLFIRTTLWRIQLPDGYKAETHGNLDRQKPAPDDHSGTVCLRKSLCRDEQPAVSVFYDKSGLAE